MALHYSKISFEHKEVVLANKPAEMIALSPKGTVPVLQLLSGDVIDESLDIIYWALKQSDPDNWLLKEKINDINLLIKKNDEKFKLLLDSYKYPNKSKLSSEESRVAAEFFLLELNTLLEINTCLFSANPSLADIAIFPFIRQFRGVDSTWFDKSKYSYLIAWTHKFLNAPVFTEVMVKRKSLS